MTTVSSSFIHPSFNNFNCAAKQAPPSGAAKIPVYLPIIQHASTISSSVTDKAIPLLSYEKRLTFFLIPIVPAKRLKLENRPKQQELEVHRQLSWLPPIY
jgi:hypothetical protein